MSQALKSSSEVKLEWDISRPELFEENRVLPIMADMRRRQPVYYCPESAYGPYWSVTGYKEIVEVDTSHTIFSSEQSLGGIVIDDNIQNDAENNFHIPNFIAMDAPKHTDYRKSVQDIAAPPSIAALSDLIRERTATLLDSLPLGEDFDWVENVSIPLTTMMLATLFDFPFEDRHKLTRWSDVTTAEPGSGIIESQQQRIGELMECLEYFTKLWNERVNAPPAFNLISMLAHSPATRDMSPEAYLGNVLLLIVGGNDTTRNSMSGSINAMNLFPEQMNKLRSNPNLIDQMVAEIIRWQTPLAHMRRTAITDTILGGQAIKKGDKVVMWYAAGNRDETVFENPDVVDIERHNARRHVSFGFGIHRCMGMRLAELQLRILWEEILQRWHLIELRSEPKRLKSNFVNGYTEMMVRIRPTAS